MIVFVMDCFGMMNIENERIKPSELEILILEAFSIPEAWLIFFQFDCYNYLDEIFRTWEDLNCDFFTVDGFLYGENRVLLKLFRTGQSYLKK
jgi:hypothetical protein